MSVAVIAVIAVFFLGMGVYALAAPAAIIRPFGVALGSRRCRDRRCERSTAGSGSRSRPCWRMRPSTPMCGHGILITVGAALVGMAFGRIASAVVDERTAFYPNWFYCIVEAVAAAALLAISAD